MSLKLQQSLEALYGLERRRDKHDLEGITRLLAALGDPHRRFRSVHVAGTNGKGSVCALIERVLRASGHRTGLFTSPHLVDFRERIRVGGRWADERWLERALARIAALPEGKDRTFFEVCTALAFLYFAERHVDIVVAEVGLGGRLDCTNVIMPEVSVITSIALDHTEILGDTLEEIAAEKAGIIKAGVPVVIGPMPEPARTVVERVAEAHAAPAAVYDAGRVREMPVRGAMMRRPFAMPGLLDFVAVRGLPTTLAGSMVALNRWTAITALEVLAARGVAMTTEALADGMRDAWWPGRLEMCQEEPRLWWDGAHNAAGIATLVHLWRPPMAAKPPAAVVLALSVDKDATTILRTLRDGFPRTRLIATRSRNERAMAPGTLAGQARAAGFEAEALPDIRTAVRHALATTPEDDAVLLTGSLFAVGEAMEAFGGAPGEML